MSHTRSQFFQQIIQSKQIKVPSSTSVERPVSTLDVSAQIGDRANNRIFVSIFKCFSKLPRMKKKQQLWHLEYKYQQKRNETELEHSHAPTIIVEKDFITSEKLLV